MVLRHWGRQAPLSDRRRKEKGVEKEGVGHCVPSDDRWTISTRISVLLR